MTCSSEIMLWQNTEKLLRIMEYRTEKKMAKIFIIEDYKNLREGVSLYLKLSGHELTEFDRTRGLEADDDDYVVKSFSAILRRIRLNGQPELRGYRFSGEAI